LKALHEVTITRLKKYCSVPFFKKKEILMAFKSSTIQMKIVLGYICSNLLTSSLFSESIPHLHQKLCGDNMRDFIVFVVGYEHWASSEIHGKDTIATDCAPGFRHQRNGSPHKLVAFTTKFIHPKTAHPISTSCFYISLLGF
jgi:hypothetical protein